MYRKGNKRSQVSRGRDNTSERELRAQNEDIMLKGSGGKTPPTPIHSRGRDNTSERELRAQNEDIMLKGSGGKTPPTPIHSQRRHHREC